MGREMHPSSDHKNASLLQSLFLAANCPMTAPRASRVKITMYPPRYTFCTFSSWNIPGEYSRNRYRAAASFLLPDRRHIARENKNAARI